MLQQVNWDEVPDSNVVPTGTYQFAVVEIESTKSYSGKVMFKAQFEIVAPECPFVGMSVWENYVVGTDDDPNADAQQTWNASIGAKRLKEVLKKSQTPLAGSMEECCMGAVGQQFVAAITTSVQTEGDYAGRSQTRISNVYPLGHSELTGPQEAEKPAPAKRAAPKAAPAPVQQQAPARPAPAAPAARAVPRQAPAVAPAAPTTPRAAPAVRPAPAKAAANPSCAICGEQVPREEFVAHVTAHQNEAA